LTYAFLPYQRVIWLIAENYQNGWRPYRGQRLKASQITGARNRGIRNRRFLVFSRETGNRQLREALAQTSSNTGIELGRVGY
jgi:hypothetical protein